MSAPSSSAATATTTPATSSAAFSPLTLDTRDRTMSGCELALQSIQSKTLEALTKSVLTRHLVTQQMRSYLQRLKLNPNSLAVVHIAGTKGKGSTGAFTERILREHGLRTALYTSPHLVHITERFRINGRPISDELFLTHFWAVWDGLVATAADAGEGNPPLPSYFRFLTLVAYHLFLTSTPAIDVVILEVGMGGKLDATNIISAPYVCGISSIGYDHMEVLGYTLTEIAHEKAGIIKPNVDVFSVANQHDDVKAVLKSVASSEKASLHFVSPLDHSVKLGLDGEHQAENAGLAVELARTFLNKYVKKFGKETKAAKLFDVTSLDQPISILPPLSSTFLTALSSTCWPGRCQRLQHPLPALRDRVSFLIDGAHTDASMKIACAWLKSQAAIDQSHASAVKHVLLFNCGHVRDPIELMIPIVALGYPNVTASLAASSSTPQSSSVAPSSSTSSSQPIHFSRVICTQFDHDRPHFSSAPNFGKLLQNYLIPQQRRGNVSMAADESKSNNNNNNNKPVSSVVDGKVHPSEAQKQNGSSTPATATTSSSLTTTNINPIIRSYLERHFNFPSTSSPPMAQPEFLAAAKTSIDATLEVHHVSKTVLTPFDAQATSSSATSATPPAVYTWQHTLFQVWQFLTAAFEDYAKQHNLGASTTDVTGATTLCTYAPSVQAALDGIQRLAQTSSAAHEHISVFVTGSLYIVGNVLQRLEYTIGD